jgi:hypothetical protein
VDLGRRRHPARLTGRNTASYGRERATRGFPKARVRIPEKRLPGAPADLIRVARSLRVGLDGMKKTNRSLPFFLAAAGVSFVASVYTWFLVDRDVGLFIGLWVPSILGLTILLSLGPGGRR